MAEKSDLFTAYLGKREVMLQKSTEQFQKVLDYQVKASKQACDEETKAIEDAITERNKTLATLRENFNMASSKAEKARIRKSINDELSQIETLNEKKLNEEKKLNKAIEHEKVRATKIAEKHAENHYRRLSGQERRIYDAAIAEKLRDNKRELDSKYAQQQAAWKKLDADSKRRAKKGKTPEETAANKRQAALDREHAKKQKAILEAEMRKTQKQQQHLKDAEGRATNLHILEKLGSPEARKAARDKKLEFAHKHVDDAEVRLSDAKNSTSSILSSATDADMQHIKKLQKMQADLRKAEKDNDKAKQKHIKEQMEKEAAKNDKSMEYLAAIQEEEAAQHELEMAEAEEKKAALSSAFSISEMGLSFVNKTADRISDNINAVYGSQSRMYGRLQGSGVHWGLEIADVMTTVGLSGLVRQKNVISKMVELVDSGVAYNLEMRAFLAETSSSIASTFDAANGTLLRMIRLQQADTTAARLGMEASLTKLFNEYFKDTSYLTDSGPADAVTEAVLGASATMSKNDSLAFEFNVQKWLGSLYSLGMSSEAVTAVAQGINMLGTGDVSKLNGNTALQTLFAMSASRAGGKSYAQMLTEGINAEDTNKLLKAMVEYLAEIAKSQTNMVTKAAYADLFNMSTTDLSTFASLTATEISNLYNSNTDYNSLTRETQNQLKDLIVRMSVGEMLDNVIDNAEVGAAITIGSNPVTYGLWKSTQILKDYVGKIEIPGITAAGFGLASGIDLLNIAQTAMAGLGLLGSLVGGIASMAKGGATNLAAWDFEEYTSRGGGLTLLASGSQGSVSESMTIGTGSGSGSDVSSVSMESGKEAGMEASGTTSEEMEEGKEIPQKILDALDGEKDSTVIHLLEKLSAYSEQIYDRLKPERVFYTAIAGVMSSDAVSALTDLDMQMAAKKYTANASSTIEDTGITQSPTTAITGATSGLGTTAGVATGTEGPLDMSEIIKTAVQAALDEFAFSNKALPVTISNPFSLPTI